MKKKYWAALNGKKIIAVGFTTDDRKFDRHCIPFSNSTFEIWHRSGARYCQLLIDSSPLQYIGKSIDDIQHKRIRKSQASFSVLEAFI